MSENQGWISLHRKMLDWEWYSDINVCRLFTHLLLKVNHKDQKWQGKLIKKGQTLTSYNTLSIETGLTVKQIRTALDKLKGTGETAVSRGYNYQVITMTNYCNYQDEGRESGSHRAVTGQSKGSQRATNNNENNENNENKKEVSVKKSPMDLYLKLASFEEFWDSYGLKTGRAKCEVSYNKAIKTGVTHETIMLGVRGYQAQCIKREITREFIKNPLTWLNGKHWDDEYERELTREEKLRAIDDVINAKKNNNLQIAGAR